MSKKFSNKKTNLKSSDRVLSSEKGKSDAGNVDAPRAETDHSRSPKRSRSATSSETESFPQDSSESLAADEKENSTQVGNSASSGKKRKSKPSRKSPDGEVEEGEEVEKLNPNDENLGWNNFDQFYPKSPTIKMTILLRHHSLKERELLHHRS